MKKGDWYYSKVIKHAKNQKLFASYNRESVINQIAKWEGKKESKEGLQFGTILHSFAARMSHARV